MKLNALVRDIGMKADDLEGSQPKPKTSPIELEERAAYATQFCEGSCNIVNQDAEHRKMSRPKLED